MRAVVDPVQFWSPLTNLDTCIEKLHDKINPSKYFISGKTSEKINYEKAKGMFSENSDTK